MYSGLVDHFGAIAGRMAYVFAVALLVSASVAHSQVIKEGGFPVKGGGVSGEPFSLSCPPRLYVAAGESVLFSCSATAVPEEGVRYAWEAVSGDGLRLLSDAQALDPLFTAPLSETSEEYGYRLTAMSAGFYRTATVAVSVGGFVKEGQEVFQAPAEECGSFGGFGRDQEGCQPWEKAPSPDSFGDVPEEEGIVPWPSFPEAPGAEDKEFASSSGAGPFPQAPPRLECPVAVFLEELETGAIECRAWDASGEEYLEYSWEPVGSTTRDYLENPRLMPEDSPNPSVVAPEAPAYETLESFRSVETTFRYRYRLTAMSRATGLSSSSEVEVFVSSSRPGVYCPLEVAVEEGETIALDCEGVDPLSSRMDYDEDGASIAWEWEGLWGASTALLDATDRSSPLFTAPAGSAGEEYHYIASMTSSSSGLPRTARRRVTVRVVGEEDVSGPTDAPYIECPDDPFERYEGEALTVICRRDFNVSTHYITMLMRKTVASSPWATFYWFGASSDLIIRLRLAWFRGDEVISHAPQVDEDTEYIFTIRICPESIADPCSASAAVASDAFTVIILDGTRLAVTCNDPDPVYEGAADFTLDCSVTNEPSGATYAWTARGSTANTDDLSSTTILKPTFDVPDDVDADTDYDYTVTLSASGIDDVTEDVTVTVLNRGALSVVCADPGSVYEGSADVAFDCEASGVSSGTGYAYSWTARGNTQDTSLLSAADIASPTFAVPDDVAATATYEYLLTVSSANAEAATADVTVTVLNRGALAVVCADPGSVYEGSADVAFDCEASGVSSGTGYAYSWTARGNTQDTSLLSAVDISSPTFHVPYAVDEDETYEYRLTVSAANAESSSARVTVTVLNKGALSVACADPGSVYEGSADVAFDCEASGAPSGSYYTYVWTASGDTQDTSLLSAADISSPTFHVPYAVDEDETYEYRLTVSAANAESSSARVTVTVLNKGALSVACADPGSVYEGSADVAFDCEASGAPSGSYYTYVWTASGDTQDTSLLSAADIASPTFHVPEEVDEDGTYEYLLTVSAANAKDASAAVTVTVLNKGALALVCADISPEVYEGSEDIELDCEASGAPAGSAYEYVWTARGDTPNTDLLSATDMASPAFAAPEEVDEDETYEYLLTVSAENAKDAAAAVTVTVLNKGALALVCADISPEVYEGSEDIELDCEASGAPAGSAYEYVWTARGDTPNTDLLSATDMASPTFAAPEEVDEDETYEYLLTVSAENAEDASAAVTVTVLNKGALAVVCVDPGSVYEGSEDVTFDCSASGAPGDNPEYAYAWTARGSTSDTSLLSSVDISSPTFHVPEEVDEDETYEYLLTVSAVNAEDAAAEVTVTVLNKGALAVVCVDPGSVYEGSEDVTFDCSASGAPGDNPEYAYAWTARGSTSDTSLLSSVDISSPTFHVPEEVDEDETYEYLLTVSAANAEDAAAEVTVTVLNKGALAVVCADPGSVYEGSEDVMFDCSASGAPGDNPEYAYAWTARGSTTDTSLLSAVDIVSPVFFVPDEVDEDETYEYLLTVSAENAEDAAAAVAVTVLDRAVAPPSDPVFPPLASSSAREPSALGVTVSTSSLRFGVQSADTRASLDPVTDQLSTRVSGPYHAGRMTLSPGGGEAIGKNGEMDLSIELASPVVLRREGGIEAASIVLAPLWSLSESCEQLSSQAIGSLYTEVTLSEDACRLLRFGGELDLTGVPSGRYAGSMDVILRSSGSEETHTVAVDVTVIPAQQVITIGPGGVRFSTSRELPAGLTEEQNLSIYPHVAFLTGEKPHGVFELSNPSLIPLEISVSARFGYTEATENGREVVVEDASGSHLGDLSQVVDIHPNVLVLQPGEKGLVRYGVQEGALAAVAEKGYAAFFDVVSEPRQYVRSDQMPEEVLGDRTARVTMRVPGVYVPGEGASQLRAALSSISYVGSMSATFLVETQDHPFVGEVVAYDGDGRELGRRETLVYTRSRVRVPLDRIPEAGTVFLRFMPRGSDRAPAPVSVEWDAPRRDIGAAGKDRTRAPATLVQKP